MRTIPRAAIALGALLVACGARGQSTGTPWTFSGSVSYYDVPHSEDYWSPIVTADRGRLHLEARYNYVGIDTGSFWAGANFSAGKTWEFDATVMFGYVIGSVQGFMPGYELTLNHDWFSLSSEGEYLFDRDDDDENFFYSWTEISGSPASWCRLGFAVQRTKAYATNDYVQRGVVAAFSYKGWEFEADWLDPDRDDETFVISLTASF